jgi:hypothetical protein
VVIHPHSLIVVPIAVLLLVEVMTRGPSTARVAGLVSAAAVAALFRWDWILFVALLEAGGAAVAWLATGMIRLKPGQSTHQVRLMAARLWWAALAALAGITLTMVVMVGYALATGMARLKPSWPPCRQLYSVIADWLTVSIG